MVIEGGRIPVPCFELCVVPEEVVGEIFEVGSVGQVKVVDVQAKIVEIGFHLFLAGHFLDVLGLNAVGPVALDHPVFVEVNKGHPPVLVRVKRVPLLHVVLPVAFVLLPIAPLIYTFPTYFIHLEVALVH